jgi:hypothetical protein
MHSQQNIKIIDGVVGIRIVGQLCRRRIYIYIADSFFSEICNSIVIIE